VKKPDPAAQKIIETFTKRRMIVNILLYIALFCFAFIFTSRFIQGVSLTGLGNSTEVGLAMGILTAALIGMIVYWRCPKCRKFIGIKVKPKACVHCGARFAEEQKPRV
jgi:hypothetical protein